LGVRRSQDAHAPAELAVEQPLEVTRQLERLAPEALHAGLVEQLERRLERRERQDRRIADLPPFRSRQRRELRFHEEAAPAIVAPPACEPRQVLRLAVAPMHEAAG